MDGLWEKVLALEDENPMFAAICAEVEATLNDEGQQLTLIFPHPFAMDYFKSRYADRVGRDLEKILGHHIALTFKVAAGANAASLQAATDTPVAAPPDDTTRYDEADVATPRSSPSPPSSNHMPSLIATPPLRPQFTFENFVVGQSNETAFTAATETTDWLIARCTQGHLAAPSSNPLLLIGNISHGKTHLLQSIAHALVESHAPLCIVYRGAKQFIRDFTTVAQQKNQQEWQQFHDRYYRADALLIDDIHVLGEGTKERTQQEFITILDLLPRDRALIAITSVQPLANLSLKPELMSRLGECNAVEIGQPDFFLKKKILLGKAALWGLPLTEGQAELVAERLDHDLRLCEGAIKSLLSEHRIGRKIDTAAIQRHFGKEPKLERFLTPAKIQEIVAVHYGISVDQLIRGGRRPAFVEARTAAMWLSATLLGLSSPVIARAFDKKEHTTVLYLLKKAERDIEYNRDFREAIEALHNVLNAFPKRS